MISVWEKMKQSFSRFLNHMAQENQKAFGDTVPDCCKLNVQNQKKK